MMKRSFLILTGTVLLFSCSGPETVEEKKMQIKEYKKQISQIEQKLESLKQEIAAEDSSALDEFEFKGVEVTTKQLQLESFNHYFEVNGSVETDQNVIVSPEANGQIKKIYVREGQKVSKGQKMAELNTEMLSNNIQEVKTQLDLAETVYKKQKNLWDQNIGSEMQYLQAKNKKETLESRLNTLYSQLDMSTITAPISGTVDEIFQQEGEFSGPQAMFARVVNLDQVKVVAEVSENYLTKINEGDSVLVSFPVLQKDYYLPITRIGNYINPQNRGFKVEVEIDNGSGLLKPNLVGILKVRDFFADSVFVVPSKVIGQDSKGTYLYKADVNEEDEKVARKTYVRTGKSSGGNTMLQGENIKRGSKVIIEGYSEVSEGSKINIVE